MNTLIPASAIELEGPWTHRHVSAGGAAFHVADMGQGMDHALVLLHGFPEHWWSWREVLPLLAESTSRVFAICNRWLSMSLASCARSALPLSRWPGLAWAGVSRG